MRFRPTYVGANSRLFTHVSPHCALCVVRRDNLERSGDRGVTCLDPAINAGRLSQPHDERLMHMLYLSFIGLLCHFGMANR